MRNGPNTPEHRDAMLARLAACAFASVFASVLLCATSAAAQPGPYAGQETRAIKSLSQAEVDDIMAGRGMGLAKAAELNGFPGPMHVLELSGKLGLTAEQARLTQAIMARMRQDAQRVGRDLIDAERHLDMRFTHGHIDAASLGAATARIGALQGELRAVHLAAHIEMKALLSTEQTQAYVAARGYGAGDASSSHQHKH